MKMKVGCVFECLIRFGLCDSINNPNVISFQTRTLLKGDERVIYDHEKQTSKMTTYIFYKSKPPYNPILIMVSGIATGMDQESRAAD